MYENGKKLEHRRVVRKQIKCQRNRPYFSSFLSVLKLLRLKNYKSEIENIKTGPSLYLVIYFRIKEQSRIKAMKEKIL